MATGQFYLAEYNISRIKAPLDSSIMKEFVDFLEPVNHFAEQSPGFIWRLAADGGQASSYLPPAYEDEMIVTNLTVWQDIDSLKNFVYQTVHTYFLRSRKKWFEQFPSQQLVMWWIPTEHTPSIEEGKQKLKHLEDQGPTLHAFTFQSLFDAEGKPLKRESDQP
jgi:hypothetical protein